MKTMNITEFKAHALRVIDEIERSKEVLLVTRHGKIVVKISPYEAGESVSIPGTLKSTLLHIDEDIIESLDAVIWDANK